jgi:hypothetical protein
MVFGVRKDAFFFHANLFNRRGQIGLLGGKRKNEPGSGPLPGSLGRRYLGYWKIEHDGRVSDLPFMEKEQETMFRFLFQC